MADPLSNHLIESGLMLLGAAGLGAMGKEGFKALIKALSHGPEQKQEVNVEVGGKDGRITPSLCAACQAEHERSLRNEAGITELKADLKVTRTQLFGKLEEIGSGVADLRVEVAKLHPLNGNGRK